MPPQPQHTTGFSRSRQLWTGIAVAALAIVLLAAFASRQRDTPVLAAQATRQTIVSTIDTNGIVEPLNNFQAHAPISAVVREIAVHEGQTVKAGELLLRLDDADARAQEARAMAQVRAAEADLDALRAGGTREEVLTNQTLLESAKAELDAAQRSLAAMQRLEQQGAASAAEVKDAQNRVSAAQAQVNLIEKKLSSRFSQPEITRAQAQLDQAQAAHAAAVDLLRQSNVRAPRAGTVYSIPVRQGQFVNAGDLLLQMADLNQVQVRAFVDEPEVGRLHQEQEVLVTWDALPGKSWEGRIIQVPATIVTRGTRNVGEAISRVNNSNGSLLPNVNVTVKIVTSREANVLAVPREAVREQDGQSFVYEIRKGTLQRQAVTTGLSNLTDIQITGGLSEGAQVAMSSTTGTPLAAEMQVQVVQR
jgi:HlyD family secretion protein